MIFFLSSWYFLLFSITSDLSAHDDLTQKLYTYQTERSIKLAIPTRAEMALTHSRSSSPEPDGATLKKRKTSHANSNGAATNGNSTATTSTNTLPAEADPTSQFATDLFDHTHIAKLHNGYKANGPFKYALVEKLFQDELLKKVKDECLSELSFTEKETDIYKVGPTSNSINSRSQRFSFHAIAIAIASVTSRRSTKPATSPRSTTSPPPRSPSSPASSRSAMRSTHPHSAPSSAP